MSDDFNEEEDQVNPAEQDPVDDPSPHRMGRRGRKRRSYFARPEVTSYLSDEEGGEAYFEEVSDGAAY